MKRNLTTILASGAILVLIMSFIQESYLLIPGIGFDIENTNVGSPELEDRGYMDYFENVSDDNFTFNIRVVEEGTNMPLSEVEVVVEDLFFSLCEGETNEEGKLQIRINPADYFEMNIQRIGYEEKTVEFVTDRNSTESPVFFDIELTPEFGFSVL